MEIQWDTVTAKDWQAAGPCVLQQSWCYGAAAARLGARVHRAEIRDGARRGIAQVLVRRLGPLGRVALVSRGPVWDGPVSAEQEARALWALRRALPGRGPALMLATPEAPVPGLLPLMTPASVAEIDLSAGPERLRAAMQGKWRNRLSRAERARLRVEALTPDAGDLDWLLQRDRAQQKQRGYRSLPPDFLFAWRAAGGAMRMFRVRRGPDTLAAMLFLDHAPGATYQIGWSGIEGRRASAHHLLLWRAMQEFSDKGLQRLDLGTVDTVTAPGLARFKIGSGARVRALGPSGLFTWPMPGPRRKWTPRPAQ